MCLFSTVKEVGVHEKLKKVGLLKKIATVYCFIQGFVLVYIYINSSCQKISNVFELFLCVVCFFVADYRNIKWVILCSLVMSFFGLLLGIFWTKPNV